jgi:hypothetical protein
MAALITVSTCSQTIRRGPRAAGGLGGAGGADSAAGAGDEDRFDLEVGLERAFAITGSVSIGGNLAESDPAIKPCRRDNFGAAGNWNGGWWPALGQRIASA